MRREVFEIVKDISYRYVAAKKRKRVIVVIMLTAAALACLLSFCVPDMRVPVLVFTGGFLLWSFILLNSQIKEQQQCFMEIIDVRKKYYNKDPDAEEAPDKKEK